MIKKLLTGLIALALLAYPREFRRHYRSQVVLDLEDRQSERGYALRLLIDVLAGGVAMRVELLWRDVSYALRVLRKAPLFTVVVTGTLAVAIAANAVIFGALEAVVLQPLPYAHVDRLAMAVVTDRKYTVPNTLMPPAPFIKRAVQSHLVDAVAVVSSSQAPVEVDGRIVTLDRSLVSLGYFSTLGVHPYIGRFFNGDDPESQAVISDAYWHAYYGGSASVIGKRTMIGGKSFTIIGVAPQAMLDPGFGTATRTDVWTVIPRSSRTYGLLVVRMREQATIAALQKDLNRLWLASEGQPWQSYPRWTHLVFAGLRDGMLLNAQMIWIFLAAALAVLLIACANIANLVLARTTAQRNEFAVRAGLGATSGRIVAQSLTEALLLCGFGSMLGLALAAGCMRPALALIPGNLPRLDGAHIDLSVSIYACMLGLVAALASSIVPALRAAGRGITRMQRGHTATALVALEVSIAFALVVCSSLLLRSFTILTAQPLGYQPQHVYAAWFMPKRFFERGAVDRNSPARVLRRVAAIPGVRGAAIGFHLPTRDTYDWMLGFSRVGQAQKPKSNREGLVDISFFSPGYTTVMGIPVVAGRDFTRQDLHGRRVVIVNEAFARRFFAPEQALGEDIVDEDGHREQIIGVVGDTRDSLTAAPRPMVYYPSNVIGNFPFAVVFKVPLDDPHLADEVIAATKPLLSQYRIPTVESLEQDVRGDSKDARTSFLLLGALTLIALLLAVAGIYAVVAFSVQRRYHEIGVRVALGATGWGMLREIVRAALAQSLIGIALGVIAAAFAARAIESRLFKVAPFDPASFIAAVALLLACTAIAALVPAWRAIRTDPAQILRYE